MFIKSNDCKGWYGARQKLCNTQNAWLV